MDIARVILSVVLALLLVMTGGGKVLSLPYSAPGRVQLALSPSFWRVTGALEIAAAVGLVWGIWFVPFGIAAATGVVALMVGAMVFRVRASDRAAHRGIAADVVVLLIAAAVIVLSIGSL
jgi:hypothetical protein